MNNLIEEKIKTLGEIPVELEDEFLKAFNKLLRADYAEVVVMRMLAEMIENPKTFAYSKNKLTLLAKELEKRAFNGEKIVLSETGKTYLPLQVPLLKIDKLPKQEVEAYQLEAKPHEFAIYGENQIEEGAIKQMKTAMSLPISVAGALMPDAHAGYGLPIGGVLATEANKIIPYAVGVDIACRMCLSVFDLPESYFQRQPHLLKNALQENTHFGIASETDYVFDSSMLDLPDWSATKLLKSLKNKAYRQLGTSGTGNHFVEWGLIEVIEQDELLNLAPKTYLALLSHSGSRGMGASVATHYSKIASKKSRLPKSAAHLAWLDIESEEGQEYWISMNLAGQYAAANHHEIHAKMAKALGEKPIRMIENHHNFAWKETHFGKEVMVHRKGATPAGKNDLGIIPASMTAKGYIIRGKGNENGLFSASHGAGRAMSRAEALQKVTRSALRRTLAEHGVQLIGGDLDEAPMAYKNIEGVMLAQTDLISVLATFTPKIVRMAEGR